MYEKLASVEQRYEGLLASIGTSAVQNDPAEYRKQAKALSELEPLVEKFREHKAVTADMVQACKTAGLAVWAWTANEPADWHRLRAAGVAAILTDDPAGLLRHLADCAEA